MEDHDSWLVLIYRPPAAPARLRTAVWRRLKTAGAVYLAHSVAVLPASPPAERFLRRLLNEISQAGGSAFLLHADPVAGGPDVIAAFSAARDEEYAGIIAGCRDCIGGMKTTMASGHLSSDELKEAEHVLDRLSGHLEKIRAHDPFGASQAEPAAAALATCRGTLDRFAEPIDGAGGRPGTISCQQLRQVSSCGGCRAAT
jgi:hypothetical protein